MNTTHHGPAQALRHMGFTRVSRHFDDDGAIRLSWTRAETEVDLRVNPNGGYEIGKQNVWSATVTVSCTTTVASDLDALLAAISEVVR